MFALSYVTAFPKDLSKTFKMSRSLLEREPQTSLLLIEISAAFCPCEDQTEVESTRMKEGSTVQMSLHSFSFAMLNVYRLMNQLALGFSLSLEVNCQQLTMWYY